MVCNLCEEYFLNIRASRILIQCRSQWQNYFNHPSTHELGLLNAIQVSLSFSRNLRRSLIKSQNIGSLAAYPFAPYLSDGIGRRPTVFIGACIMCIATALQGASQSEGMFVGARYVSLSSHRIVSGDAELS